MRLVQLPQEGNGALLLDDCSILRCGFDGSSSGKAPSFSLAETVSFLLLAPYSLTPTETLLSNFRCQATYCDIVEGGEEEPLHLHRVLICKYLCIQCS